MSVESSEQKIIPRCAYRFQKHDNILGEYYNIGGDDKGEREDAHRIYPLKIGRQGQPVSPKQAG